MTITLPDNQTPELLCEGGCASFVHHPHHFIERRLRRRGTVSDDFGDTIWDFIFACDNCKAERVFGCESF